MFQFPPTSWQVHGLAWSATTGFWFAAVVVLLRFLLVKRSGSAWLCGFWAFVGTASTLILLGRISTWTSTYQPPYPCDVALQISMPIVCAIGLFWALWANRRGTEGGGFTAMAGTILATVIVGVHALMPSGVSHHSASVRTQCKNNLKQIGLAFHSYHDIHRLLPPASISKPPKSWRVNLLPFLERQKLYESYDQSVAWDSKTNRPLTLQRTVMFECPARPKRAQTNAEGQFLTAYTVPVGAQSMFDGSQQVRFRNVEDGLSNTLMVVESCGTDIVWSEPRDSDLTRVDFSVNAASLQIDRSNSLLSSYHSGMAWGLLGDGSVRALSAQTDPNVLKALITKAARDDTGSDW